MRAVQRLCYAMRMKMLVTGIAGFIGSHVADRLVARGDEVVGLDNFDPFYDRRIKERNLAGVRGKARLLEGDIADRDALDKLFAHERFDAVIHLAALAGVRPSIQQPWRYQQVNVVGTSHIAETMVAHGVKRLVFASSSSVYGDNTELPFRETHRVDEPASPYAASKRAGELLLKTLHKVHGFDVSCLRYFTVYGPRQRPEMAIHKFCRAVDTGNTITLFGDGSSSRDYTYVGDIADGTIAALDRAPGGYSIYNLGNTHTITLNDLVDKVGQAVGKPPIIKRISAQPGDVAHTHADVSSAQRDLGYAPSVSIDEGLAQFVMWMRQQPTAN